MEIQELRNKVQELGFTEKHRNVFVKSYKIRSLPDESKNYITTIYKVSKGILFFKVKQFGKTETVSKGKLSTLFVNENNEIEGLKKVKKY